MTRWLRLKLNATDGHLAVDPVNILGLRYMPGYTALLLPGHTVNIEGSFAEVVEIVEKFEAKLAAGRARLAKVLDAQVRGQEAHDVFGAPGAPEA